VVEPSQSSCLAGQLENLCGLEPGNFCLCVIRQTLPVWRYELCNAKTR
jgi:hypothetical protein